MDPSLVAYHASLSAAPTSPRKTIRGIDRPHRSSSKSTNQVRWKWRGKGFLRIISSHWQPLGYSFKSNSDPETDHQVLPEETDWVITYFSKTLFTPAGIDIYSRTGTGLPNDVKAQLVEVRLSTCAKLERMRWPSKERNEKEDSTYLLSFGLASDTWVLVYYYYYLTSQAVRQSPVPSISKLADQLFDITHDQAVN